VRSGESQKASAELTRVDQLCQEARGESRGENKSVLHYITGFRTAIEL
jgi:hypothetical protein